MYLGNIVELGEMEEVLQHPKPPDTRALRSAAPVPDPRLKREPAVIKGGVSKPIDLESRCRFYNYCPLAA